MPEEKQIHLQALENGEFARAKEEYGTLLETDPENLEYQCGFFAAGWWENRQEARGRKKAGRPLATFLTQEWETFESAAQERGCSGSLALRAVMRSVLSGSADHFRIAFQEEGSGSVEPELLLQLGRCLIRIEDYKNASDVLSYARKIGTPGAAVHYLLGEALCAMSGESRNAGLSYYRDAFALDPLALDPTLIASQPAARVFGELSREKDGSMESILEWFPAYFIAAAFAPGLRPLGPDEVQGFVTEADRLYKDLEIVVEKYQEKVRARAAFQDIVLVYHFTFHERDSGRAGELEGRLKVSAPDLFRFYRKERAMR